MIDLLGAPGAAEKHPELLPLLEDISGGNLPAHKDKIDAGEFSGQLPVRPIYKKVMPRTVDEALQRLTKRGDVELPGLAGIYYDVERGVKVATNRDVLCVVPCGFGAEEESRVVGAEGKFPNWFGVLPPSPAELSPKLDALDLLAKVRGAERATKFMRLGSVNVILEREELHVFDAALFASALVALVCTGTKEVCLEVTESAKAVTIHDANKQGKLVVVMPRIPAQGGPFEKENIIYKHI